MPFESRFGHAADEFQRYRPDYPAALYERILAEIPQQYRERAMDLGAGTGVVSGHWLAHFREVVAVEPDAGMATKIAEQFPRVAIRKVTAEDCEQPADTVDLISIANALHWMDAGHVLEKAHRWLRPGAVLAVFDRPLPKATLPIDGIVLAELRGPWKPHRDPRLKRGLVWQDLVRTAPGFEIVEEKKFANVLPTSPGDYAGFWRSTSYGSAYARTLDDPEQYWSDLESRFAAASSGMDVSVDFSPTLILARKT
jgi:SAM-dependent methyltransferase